MKVTFENFPSVLSEIRRDQQRIILLLEGKLAQDKRKEDLLTTNELINYLPEHPSAATVYGWLQQGRIPSTKVGRCRYFKKADIDLWINNGRPFDTFKK